MMMTMGFALVFRDGTFTTRRSVTSEVLVRGSYDVSGNELTMRWYSPVTQQEVTARCTQWGAKGMLCDQPGRGASGEGFLRCCFATGMDQIQEAMKRMSRFVSSL